MQQYLQSLGAVSRVGLASLQQLPATERQSLASWQARPVSMRFRSSVSYFTGLPTLQYSDWQQQAPYQ